MAEEGGKVEGGPSSAEAEVVQERRKPRIVYDAAVQARLRLWERARQIVETGDIPFLRDDGRLVIQHRTIDKAEEDRRLMAQNALDPDRSNAPLTLSADPPSTNLWSFLRYSREPKASPPVEVPVAEVSPPTTPPIAPKSPPRPRVQWAQKRQRVVGAVRRVPSWSRDLLFSLCVLWPLGFHLESLDELKTIIDSQFDEALRKHLPRFSFHEGGWQLRSDRVKKWRYAIRDHVLLWRLSRIRLSRSVGNQKLTKGRRIRGWVSRVHGRSWGVPRLSFAIAASFGMSAVVGLIVWWLTVAPEDSVQAVTAVTFAWSPSLFFALSAVGCLLGLYQYRTQLAKWTDRVRTTQWPALNIIARLRALEESISSFYKAREARRRSPNEDQASLSPAKSQGPSVMLGVGLESSLDHFSEDFTLADDEGEYNILLDDVVEDWEVA